MSNAIKCFCRKKNVATVGNPTNLRNVIKNNLLELLLFKSLLYTFLKS